MNTAVIEAPEKAKVEPLFTGSNWDFETIDRVYEAIRQVAEEYGLDTYPNQIEIISSEQMLDAYSTNGLPIGYPHWSFGKEFVRNEQAYKKGMQGLAYEIVINTNPCIGYLMEENTMMMQTLVIAHACFGHNSFFKGNSLFRQFTDAEAIIDFMVFAKNKTLEFEERYGRIPVEEMYDSCHALSNYGIDRYKRPVKKTKSQETARDKERLRHEEYMYDELFSRTVPPVEKAALEAKKDEIFPTDPQENILYFVQKHSPKLLPWQREIVRIARKVAQYFFPQGQTKMMNEGWATFWHYTIINRLHEKGLLTDGAMQEFLISHTNVIKQPSFDEKYYNGINPYALGFAMFSDIRRICEHPTEEDREWFPDIAGSDWIKTLDYAMRNFKDESFILQYLSPKLMRQFKFFAIADHASEETLMVDSIHNEDGYRRVRKLLSEQHNRLNTLPDIQVTRYDRNGSRELTVRHKLHRGRPLTDESSESLKHLARLHGFPVILETVDEDGKKKHREEFKPTKFSNE